LPHFYGNAQPSLYFLEKYARMFLAEARRQPQPAAAPVLATVDPVA
jgi:hypothetical protein